MRADEISADTWGFAPLYSGHAHRRRNERCKSERLLARLYNHFDRDVYVRGGVWAWSITADRLDGLVEDGVLSRREADRLINLVVLIAENDNEVITVIRGSGRRIGKYYRRVS